MCLHKTKSGDNGDEMLFSFISGKSIFVKMYKTQRSFARYSVATAQ